MGKRRAREIWEYDSMAEFEADGGAASYGDGVFKIGHRSFTVANGKIKSQSFAENTIAGLGDSFDERALIANTSGSLSQDVYAIWHLTNMLMMGKLDFIHIDGISGTGALAGVTPYRYRIAAVIDANPAFCALRCSVNDFMTYYSLTDLIAEYSYLFEKLNNAGIKVIANTVGPSDNYDTTAKRSNWVRFNKWLVSEAQSQYDLILLPQHYIVADHSVLTGAAGTLADAIGHPTLPGAFLMAQNAANILSPHFSRISNFDILSAVGTNDETAIDPNPLNIGAGPVATGFNTFGQSNGVATLLTPSIVSRTDGPGNWQQIIWTPDAVHRWLQWSFTSVALNAGMVIGDTVQAFMEVDVGSDTAAADVHYPILKMSFTGTAITCIANPFNSAHPALGANAWRGVVSTPKIAIPNGCTGISVQYGWMNKTTGQQTYRIGRHGVLNHSRI